MSRLPGRVSEPFSQDSTALPRLLELDAGGSNLVYTKNEETRCRKSRNGCKEVGPQPQRVLLILAIRVLTGWLEPSFR